MKIIADKYDFVFCAGNNQTEICSAVVTSIDGIIKGCSIYTVAPNEDHPRLNAHYDSIPDFIRIENAVTHTVTHRQL